MTHEGYFSVDLYNCRPGFRMVIFCCGHMVGTIFSMKYLLIIGSNHIWAFGPILFSCSTNTSFLPAAVLSLVMPFLYSFSLNGYIMEVSHSVAGVV